MKSNGNYDWKFRTVGGVTRVNISTGADIAHLDELDQKLWTVLSCPVKGLEMDDKSLSLIDADQDGRIHVNDVLATAKWLCGVLKDPQVLIGGGDSLKLDAISQDSEEGKALFDACAQVLETSGSDKDCISLQEAEAYLEVVSAKIFNGDGIITPAAAGENEALKQTITDAVATQGGKTDRSGEAGVDTDLVEAFYTAVSEYSEWKAAGDADKANVFPYGDNTAAALAAVQAIKPKVDDFFLRCKLAAFNTTDASLNVSDEKIKEIGMKNLSNCVDEIAEYPLAKVSADMTLPLSDGINPAWEAAVASLKALVIATDYPDAEALTEEQWGAIQARFAAYNDWNAAKKGASVESLGIERVGEIIKADQKAAILDLIAQDKALEAGVATIESAVKLLVLHRDFYTFLRNFVTFDDFYASVDGKTKAIFQAGTLFIDQRSTDLCIRVADMSKHGDMAGLSGMFILYCQCTSKVKGQTMDIAAVLTEGQIASLRVGQNAVFYDRQGADWDAVVTKIVDNPISVKQAFWAPYRKFANTISERMKKNVADKENKVSGDMTSKASSVNVPVNQEQAADAAKNVAPQPKSFDIAKFAGIAAALSMAAALLGTAIAALVKPWYTIFIALGALVLCISGPSMIMTWIKLKRRNVGPVLNANGWAVNSKTLVNTHFGSFFTRIAELPKVKGKDPLADRTPFWKKALIWLVVIAALLFAAWRLVPARYIPFLKHEPVEAVDIEAVDIEAADIDAADIDAADIDAAAGAAGDAVEASEGESAGE